MPCDRRSSLAFALALAACPAGALEPPPVSPQALAAHATFLADDLLRGRDTGTPGYEIAARYVASQFRLLGLEPAGDAGSFLQSVPLLVNHLEIESLRLTARRGSRTMELAYKEDFILGGDPLRAETGIEAPVVFAGYGVRAPALGHDDYAGLELDGRIALILTGAPESFPHDQRAYYSSRQVKTEAAVAAGAAGLLVVPSEVDAVRVPWERMTLNAERPGMRWLDGDGRPARYYPEIRASALVGHGGAEKILAGTGFELGDLLAGRHVGSELPVVVSIARTTGHERIESSNVAAVLRGSDEELAGEYVVYTAHLDHVGVGAEVDGDDLYNGFYDNAMGVAVLLETARAFTALSEPPRRSVLFLAVTAEERGLLGSDYFAHHPTVPVGSLVANVNLDMPLFLYPLREVVAFGAEHSSLAAPVAAAAAAVGWEVAPDPMPEEVLFIRSDQYSLVRQGVPAVFLVSGIGSADREVAGQEVWRRFLGAHYHRPSDDGAQPIDWDSAVRFTQANFLIGQQVANAGERPRWNEGDFFGELFAAADGSPPAAVRSTGRR